MGQQWKKNINAQKNLVTLKKQGMTPQTIYILVYKTRLQMGYEQHKNYQ